MRIAGFVYSIVAYAAFLASLLWAIVFLAGGMDRGTPRGAAETILVDAGLLGLFAVQDTIMARAAFKERWTRVVPEGAERSTYVLAASAILLLTFWQWRPEPALLWRVEWGPAALALWALFALGWLILAASTFMTGHLEMFGLRHRPVAFKERWLYAWVRHPMMLGLLIAFWATPRMSAGHLLFAVLGTGYIVVGTLAFEERDLRRALADEYRDYARRVPAFVPRRRAKGLGASLRCRPRARRCLPRPRCLDNARRATSLSARGEL